MLSPAQMKIFIIAVVGVVVAAIVAGFFVVGSPFEERIRRFDDRRIVDLQFLQSEIVNFWIQKERLPQDLSELRDEIRGITIPKDPETGEAYEYRVIHDLTFALCASFNRPSRSLTDSSTPKITRDPYYGVENWEHGEGQQCFERTIDPDIYRPKLKEAPAQD